MHTNLEAGMPRHQPHWLLARQEQRIERITDWRIADCVSELVSWRFRDLAPPRDPLSSADSESAREMAHNATLGSFGCQFEAAPGPAQFQ
eukprot:305557-Alexandrium_andersonii.AAC.1